MVRKAHSDRFAYSHPNTAVASKAPVNWAAINAGMLAGLMPLKVSVKLRAIVTAGLAKLVEAVNQ